MPMEQRNIDDSIWRKTNDKMKMIKMLKFKALINST